VDFSRPVRARAAIAFGTPDHLDAAEPLVLDYEDQYRRSEEPYPGPEEFSAVAAACWTEGELHLAIDVRTADPIFRPANAPPLRLDNEPDDIHSDGIQVYLRPGDTGPVFGFLLVPEEGGSALRVRVAGGTDGTIEMVRGRWERTEGGYSIGLSLTIPDWDPHPGDVAGFDLLINRMEHGRTRRSGQLVWSGGGGWVYLRGDRQDPASLGILELR
jgi:hypothetical protein